MTVEALKAEMAGYLMRGLDDRANEVAAEIRRLGSDVETASAEDPVAEPNDSTDDNTDPDETPAEPVVEDPAPAKPTPRKRIR